MFIIRTPKMLCLHVRVILLAINFGLVKTDIRNYFRFVVPSYIFHGNALNMPETKKKKKRKSQGIFTWGKGVRVFAKILT